LPSLLEDVEVNFQTKFAERLSTGYYLPAGVNLLIRVTSGNIKGWQVRIGGHTDDLSWCEYLRRFPCVSTCKSLETEMSISSPYGGLVYFESPAAGNLSAYLTNVLEAPYIDLQMPETINDWKRRRQAPGLWAELAGENIIFTTPSSCIRNLDNPIEVLRFWDRVVATHHECRGTNVTDSRRERIVNDIQPSAGYMHSGYPIVTHLDCCQPEYNECIFDLDKLKLNGCWGLFHEIGHNMQRSEWTFDGCGEVTVNIFSMHATKFVIGQDIINQAWPLGVKGSFKNYFAKVPNYDDWKADCCMALMTFAQLIKHFGWESMRKFMKDYEQDKTNNHAALPKNNQEKIDQWVLRYSRIVGKNIKPQFEMFGLPVSNHINDQLRDLPAWCPENEKDGNVFFAALK
jgi:hypothetical protein